jgi:hypothetical protein
MRMKSRWFARLYRPLSVSTMRAQWPPSPGADVERASSLFPARVRGSGESAMQPAGRYVQLSGRSTGMIPVGAEWTLLSMRCQEVPAQMWASPGQGHDGFTTSGSRAQTRCCSKNTPRPSKATRHNPRA